MRECVRVRARARVCVCVYVNKGQVRRERAKPTHMCEVHTTRTSPDNVRVIVFWETLVPHFEVGGYVCIPNRVGQGV